ncbi:uncharacterized protein SPPG_05452 [Spizellomyces punctatus DAOM BR117]|uniref:Plasma membrane fusion protein PRM1 n=1 Tax=Spizellomyces punctatus (strain DAOM BR117) TaxID=645134 RepID=A0A0L0HDV7_SPIPD|nr:uncharacterized protein SPPG_05452 [Spizellomyces punctatus DAOM BR117]KNC99196.1 hypothetical protein SPPG_05452 [Spizellomyces punctatus DAOM BR117]|eukprot:XP_016607236.1 hypothetical protein SPPG_05452 [Spizellomyces punctatus DAOM BR117]
MPKRKNDEGLAPQQSGGDLLGVSSLGFDILSKGAPTTFSVKEWNTGGVMGSTMTLNEDTESEGPYVGLSAKLSRAFVTHIVFALVVVLYTLLILAQTVKEKGEETKQRLRSGCNGMEVAATAMASVPHYAAAGFNQATVDSINAITSSTAKMLSGAVAMLNELVLMVLQSYTNLLFCILDAFVGLAVNTVAMYAEQITDFLNTQLAVISNALEKSLDVLNGQLQNFVDRLGDAINTIADVFGGHVDGGVFQPVRFPSVSNKLNFQIPDDFVNTLKNLSNEVPSFEDLGEQLATLISKPFGLLEGLIDDQLGDLKGIANDAKLVPIPAVAGHVQFCDDAMDYGWIDELVHALNLALLLGAGLVAAIAFFSILANMVTVVYDHWQFEKSVRLYAKILQDHKGINQTPVLEGRPGISTTKDEKAALHATARDLIHAAGSPAKYRWMDRLTKFLFRSERSRVRFHWFVDYVSHKPSLLCVCAGLLGLGMVLLQMWMIDIVKEKTAQAVSEGIHASMDKLVRTVVAEVYGVAQPYVDATNNQIDLVETTTNRVLFGWIGNIIDAINNTMSTFEQGFNNALNSAFGSVPPLKTALVAFANCVVGSKIRTLEAVFEALTTKSHLTLPRIHLNMIAGLDDDAIRRQLQTAQSIMDTSPAANTNATMDGSTENSNATTNGTLVRRVRRDDANSTTVSDDEESIFKREVEAFLESYRNSLRQQILPFLAIFGFGSLVFFMGLIRVCVWVIGDHIRHRRGAPLEASKATSSLARPANAYAGPSAQGWFRKHKSSMLDSKKRQSEEMLCSMAGPHPPGMDARDTLQPQPVIGQALGSALLFRSTTIQSPSDSPVLTRERTVPKGPRQMGEAHAFGSRPNVSPSGPREMHPGTLKPSGSQGALSSFIKPSKLTNRPVSGVFSDWEEKPVGRAATAPASKASRGSAAHDIEHLEDDTPRPTTHPYSIWSRNYQSQAPEGFDDWNEISNEAAKAVAMLAAKAKHHGGRQA